MKWRFTIIDRDGVSHVIDEPAGWDAMEIIIKRDPEGTHGIFFDYQGNDFQFTDQARKLIQDEYDNYGVEGNLELVIEQKCEGEDYEELYRGRLLFSRYNGNCGDECYVKIPIETTGDVMQLRNRWDQKVDLQTAKAFDGTTNLTPYAKLGFTLKLPSKGIFIQDTFLNDANNGTTVLGVPQNDSPGGTDNSEYGMVEIGFNQQKAAEIGNAGTELQPRYTAVETSAGSLGTHSTNKFRINSGMGPFIAPLDITAPVNFQEGTPNYDAVSNPCTLDIDVKCSITNISSYSMEIWAIVAVLPSFKGGTHDADYAYLLKTNVLPTQSVMDGQVINCNFSYFDDNFTLNQGDQIYCFLSVYHARTNAVIATDVDSFSVNIAADSHFKLTSLSKTAPTSTKAFMVNEAISRISEAITDGKIRAYSDYFGRTNSEPYAAAADGCGSLEAITKGLFIRRQENRIPDQPFQIALSLKDMWEGLDPIHHIGFGIEHDDGRAGFRRLRVEPWKYFYKSNIVLECAGVAQIQKKVIEQEHYSTFRFGYEKWEAEEYTGLDEFLTKRQFRTTLTQIKNELVKISKFIASGYAWEITRRKGNQDSKDWRFDNDTFIACLVRKSSITESCAVGTNKLTFYNLEQVPDWATVGTVLSITMTDNDNNPVPVNDGDYTITSAAIVSGVLQIQFSTSFATPLLIANVILSISGGSFLEVELGNINSPQNIIDPDTIYNYRISPIRNAMRWMDKVLASYRKIDPTNKIIFMDGDGNYHASGEMTGNCKWENAALAENDNLDVTRFADIRKAAPLLRPERDEFEYPMSVRDFKLLLASPYDRISYSNDCEASIGWIDEVKYRPEEGMATFTLIPCFTILDADLHHPQGLATEDYQFIETEDNQTILTE